MLSGSDVFGGCPFGDSGLLSPLPLRDANHPSKPPLISDSDRRALKRLVSSTVPNDELLSVIGTIVSNVKAANIVTELEGNDAQTFADIIYEACHHAIPSLRIGPLTWFEPSDFRWSGVGYPRFRITDPKEMCEIVIQDVCWPLLASGAAPIRVAR